MARPRPDGVVLAGGRGRRLGGPKAALPLGGRTLVAHAVDLLRPRCGRVVVVARSEVPMPPLDVPVVVDDPGPPAALTGLATGLAAVRAADVLVLACDLPLAGPALDALAALPPGCAAVAVDDDGRAQPLCARYPRAAALDAARAALGAGRLALGALLDDLAPRRVTVPGALLNVNTAEDLEHARRALGV